MDTGSKSLAQLAEEGKEKKYVTLDVGSKVSGYTRDYLERLCRLQKVEYLLRENNEHAIELESLLRETHTILLSYEGVDFVDRSTLREESASDAFLSSEQVDTTDESEAPSRPEFVKQVPRFGESHDLNARLSAENPFAYVGRSVISDGTSPDPVSKKEIRIPVGVTGESSSPKEEISPIASLSLKEIPPSPPPPPPASTAFVATDSARSSVSHSSLHLPISDLDQEEEIRVHAHEEKNALEDTKESHRVDVATATLSLPETTAPLDEWDRLLFGGEKVAHDAPPASNTSELPVLTLSETISQAVPPSSTPSEASLPVREEAPFLPLANRPSVYRPIKTSVDASVHHDDAPLLPPLSKDNLPPRAPTRVSAFVPPPGQKVVVFEPKVGVKLPPQFEKRRIDPLISPLPKPGSEAIPKAPERTISTQGDQSLPGDHGSLAPSVASSGSTSLSASLSTRIPSPLHVDGRLPSPFSASSSIGNTLSHELASREAHELLPYVDHSLVSRESFGMIVSGALGLVGMVVFGGVLLGNLSLDLNSTLYVASVGSEMGNGELEFPEKEEGSHLKGFLELLNSRHETAPSELPLEVVQSTSTPPVAEE
jgi:hypothetical protein